MHSTHFDAIVIGAGPAGASAAFDLARAGVKTLLIEKHRLPRHKTCGGGITHKTAKILPFDISSVVEQTINGFVFSYQLRNPRLIQSPDPLVYMVRRSEFDNLLSVKAVQAGAEIHDATAVTDITLENNGVTISTSSGHCSADFLVGADGAMDPTARAAGLMEHRILLPAVEHEVEVSPQTAETWQQTMSLDLGTLRASYGWVFPKEDHLNVGVGGSGRRSDFGRELKQYDSQHLNQQVPDRLRIRKTFGYVLPLRAEGTPIQRGRVMLVGDAAGLVEALTGEGIYYAVRSGQLAARAIIANAHTKYEALIDEEIMADLLIARHWAAIYRWLPIACYLGPLYSRRAWHATRKVLRGDYQIRNVNRRLGLLGKLSDLLPAYA